MKNTEFKKMSVADLKKNLMELLKEQFNLRMQRGLGALPKPHLFKKARRDIARIKTALQERESQ